MIQASKGVAVKPVILAISFWKKVSTALTPGSTYSPKVGSAETAKDICNLWFSHYKTLFTSVGYDSNTVEGIISDTSLPSVDELKLVSCTEVCDIVAAMSNNKAGDCYGLRAEHFKLAGLCNSLLATCFNVMLVHEFLLTQLKL